MSQTKSVQKTEIRAKTPYNKAQGYATKSCCPSIANAEIKILEAEKLHHPIIVAVRRIPTIPCKENTTAKDKKRHMEIINKRPCNTARNYMTKDN